MNNIHRKWKVDEKVINDWYSRYKRRHSHLALHVSEGISTARAEAFNPERASNFSDSPHTKLWATY
jgi:hypothetical protein